MLSIKKLSSSSEAGRYYNKADYYTKGQSGVDISSEWFGTGAGELGLNGFVDKDLFVKVLEGDLPNGQSLKRPSGDRVPGWDLTFSAPKSVSILSLVGGDDRLMRAHFDSVKESLSFLEREFIVSRIKKDGSTKMISTESLVSALFTHTTSRALDPQLHTHSVIVNAAKGPEDIWRSIESSPIFKNKMLLGQVYRAELALRAKELGYEIEWDRQKGTFEIQGVGEHVLSHFSKRRKEITNYADNKGLEGGREMAEAALKTRASKKNVRSKEIITLWDDSAKQLNFDPSIIIEEALKRSKYTEKPKTTANIEKVVRVSYRNLSYNEAVFTRQELINESFLFSRGEISVKQISNAIDNLLLKKEILPAKLDTISKNQIAYTTPHAIDIELHNLQLMSLGMNEVGSIARSSDINLAISAFNKLNPLKVLSTEQAESIFTALSSNDRVTGIQGYAGVGKSTSLQMFREIAEARGFNVKGYGPTGKAAQELQKSAGIHSNTIDSLLESLNKSSSLHDMSGDIWVIDEASMSNSRHLNQLLSFSRKVNSRLLLVGDKSQLSAVEQGKPFEQLQDEGLPQTVMSNIQRQKNEDIRRAVFSSINGDIQTSLRFLKQSKSSDTDIISIKNAQSRMEQSVAHYVDLIHEAVNKGLTYDQAITTYAKLIIPDNKGRREANKLVRELLQGKGLISNNELTTTTYINTGMKPEERADTSKYKKGQIVRFLSNRPELGVTENSYYKVENVDKKGDYVYLSDKSGNAIKWEPSKHGGRDQYGVSVYDELEVELSTGDFIRWRDKNEQAGLKNSDIGKIIKIKGTSATIETASGNTILINLKDDRYKHFEHEYASTTYAAQGDTYQKIIAKMDSHQRNLVTQKAFYVTLSRAVTDVTIYTDNEKKTIEQLQTHKGTKTSALEATGYTYGTTKKNTITGITTVAHTNNVEDSLLDAIAELSIKEAVFSRNQLLKLTFSNMRGVVDIYEINSVIDSLVERKEIIPAKLEATDQSISAYTTGKSIIEEWRNVEYINRGLGKFGKIASPVNVSDMVQSPALKHLTPLSKKNLTDILVNPDRFSGVEIKGRAEQLEVLSLLNTSAQLRGFNIKALNISAAQANSINKELGMQSQALASFLYRMQSTPADSLNDIWVVDQAQLLSSVDFGKLLSLADKLQTKIIFTGDTKEIAAIEKGSPYAQAIKSGMKTVRWGGVKSNVIDYSRIMDEALEIKDSSERLNAATQNYVSLSPTERDNHILWVPDKQNRDVANKKIRELLKNQGELRKLDTSTLALSKLSINTQEAKNPMSFIKGGYIKLHNNHAHLGLKSNTYYKIQERTLQSITLLVNGKPKEFQVNQLEDMANKGISQYKQTSMYIANGEKIRWKESNRALGINSGEVLTVVKSSKTQITAKNEHGKVFSLNPDELSHTHYDYAYSSNHFDVAFGKYDTASAILESKRTHLLSQKTINTLLSTVTGNITTFIDNRNKVLDAIHGSENNKQSALKGVGLEFNLSKEVTYQADAVNLTGLTAEQAISKSVSHLYNNDAVFKRMDVLKHAIAFSGLNHEVLNDELDRQIKAGDLIQASLNIEGVSHEAMITTKSAYRRESYMVEVFKHGLKERKVLGTRSYLNNVSEKFGFTEPQEKVMTHLLFSKDSVTGLEGNESLQLYDTLKALNIVASKRGMNVKMLSPRSEITQRLQSNTGIKGQNTQSLITSLTNQRRLPRLKRDVWVIAASELLSTKEMADILTLGRQTGARIILAGDTKQNASVGQGMPFNQLKSNGLKTASLYVNDPSKSKVTRLAWSDAFAGHASKAIKRLDKDIVEIPDSSQRIHRVISDYLKVPPSERGDYMVVMSSNKDKVLATKLIREGLKKEGVIEKAEKTIAVLEASNLSKEQRGMALFYEPGMQVRFNKAFKSLDVKEGQYFTVINIENDTVSLQSVDGKLVKWSPDKIAGATERGVSVYKSRSIEVAKGDVLRLKEKNKAIKGRAGDVVTVSKIDDQFITVHSKDGNSHTIPLRDESLKHVTHSYVETYMSAHSAKSVKYILGVIESYQKKLLNRKSFYTVLNKASERFYGYTDSVAKVQSHLEKASGNKLNAIDVAKQQDPTRDKFIKNQVSKDKLGEKKVSFAKKLGSKLFGGRDRTLPGPEF